MLPQKASMTGRGPMGMEKKRIYFPPGWADVEPNRLVARRLRRSTCVVWLVNLQVLRVIRRFMQTSSAQTATRSAMAELEDWSHSQPTFGGGRRWQMFFIAKSPVIHCEAGRVGSFACLGIIFWWVVVRRSTYGSTVQFWVT